MPPEPLPFDRKDRKPSSSEPVGIVSARWRQPPTTPSHHKNHGSSLSSRWGGGGGPSSFSVHGKPVGGSWHITTAELRPREYKYCRNDSSKENNSKNNRESAAFCNEKDLKGGNSRENTASPNGNSHSHSEFVNSWDQLQLNDKHAKNKGGGVSTTGGQRLKKENSLGSSLDWKPLKWPRSGSLPSRGSGFSHSSSCKIIGVDSLDTKIETQRGNNTPLQSSSGDAAPCVTPRTHDEASCRKKPRLGWGEGLAKYEKKKVGPDDIVDKEAGARNGMVDGLSSSEPLLPSPNLPNKSPSLTGYSECASPASPCSFACSSSPGLEEKESIKAAAVDNGTCNHHHTEGLSFSLENLDLSKDFNLSSSLDELLQADDSSAQGSCFVKSTAMDKLHVWKADISRTLETTESEIDALEYELRSLISGQGSSPLPAASSSFLTECNNKNTEERCGPLPPSNISSGDTPTEKADSSPEECTGVKHLDGGSPGTAISEFVESMQSDAVELRDCDVNLDIGSEKTKCFEDHVGDDMLGVVTFCGDGNQVPTGSSSDIRYSREDKLKYDLILASNKVLANKASDELSKILPDAHLYTNIPRATNQLLVRKFFAMRKRFLAFKERVITLKFQAFRYSWKEDLRLLSIRRFCTKSQKKFELSSCLGSADHQKYRFSIHSRSSSPAGSLSLVPTTEIVDYVNKLLSDSRVRVYRNALKMPPFILDKSDRVTSMFISDNRLVENPIDVEKERSNHNPWITEEKDIFLDKYAFFGKDFKKIASFLEHKTIADCVEFYYKNHKSDVFQNIKKSSEVAKGKSYTNNTYLVTSGRRLNRETGATSLEMLGAASAMVADVECGTRRQQKSTPNHYIGTSSDLAMFSNDQETAAADVLAGICGSISSEALGSCITSSVDHGDVHHGRICQKLGGSANTQHLTHEGSSLNDVDEETCSDDSCGEEVDPSDWTDEEKSSFIQAVKSYGKDFSMISRCMRTRSKDECRVFFSKARKCLGLDVIHLDLESEGTTDGNQGGGGDHDDTCMVDSGSVISHDKSSDFREEHAESDQNVVNCRETEEKLLENKPEVELVGERSSKDNLGDLNSASRYLKDVFLDLSIDHGNSTEFNASKKVSSQKRGKNYAMSILFPRDPTVLDRKTQRCSSTDGYNLHLQKQSLLDCVESSQALKGCHVMNSANKGMNGSLSYNEPQINNFKLDTSLVTDHCAYLSQERMQGSSSYVKRPSRSGDVKLFGQILTNHSSTQANGSEQESDQSSATDPNVGKSFNLKFDNDSDSTDRKLASLDVDRGNKYSFRVENNVPLRSHGFWDGNRIQLPDSAILLAKYPAAFSNTFTSSKLSGNEQRNSNVVSGFQSRKPGSKSDDGYGRQEVVTDPVAAIRKQYAKIQKYKGGCWRSDIGNR